MPAFHVYINYRKVCRAGLKQAGDEPTIKWRPGIPTLSMRRLILLVLSVVLVAGRSLAAAEDSKQLEVEIRKMLELTGAGSLGATIGKNLLTSLKSSMPKVPPEFWTMFEKEMKPEEVVELVVPVYAKHLTLEEIRAANAFYSTPEGQSLIKKLPVIMNDAMQAGQQWGEKIGKRAIEKLQEQGFLPKKA